MEDIKSANSFLDQYAGQGAEEFGARDVKIPFLKILTKGCPETEEENPGYVKGAKNGMFMNTLTKELYGDKVTVIPVHYEPLWVCWAPNRGGFKGRHKPGTIEVVGSPFDKGGMKDMEGNSVTENMTYYVLREGHLEDGLMVLSLTGSGLGYAQIWNSYMLMTKLDSGKRAPTFAGFWDLKLEYNMNQDGSWHTIGSNKKAAVAFNRFMTETEWKEYIEPNRKLALSAMAVVDYAQISDNRTRQITDETSY